MSRRMNVEACTTVLPWNSETGSWIKSLQPMAVIQLFLLDAFVNQNRIWSQLEYMSSKTGYPWSLDFFHFVNRQ